MINTVCLCGSTRFIADFERANVALTKQGLSIISISFALPKDDPKLEGLKSYLDLIHLNKILRSDAIFIVGDGYIGESTAREILWADMQNKPIITQWTCSGWVNAAHMLRSSSWHTDIIPKAKLKLGL